jgi:hypothetical protein
MLVHFVPLILLYLGSYQADRSYYVWESEDIRLSRSTVAFSGVFLGLERARPESRFWASLVDFRFSLKGSEPFTVL